MKVAVPTLLLLSSPVFAAPIPLDLVVHASIAANVAVVSAVLLNDTEHPVLYSFAVGMVPGLLKYEYDRHIGGYVASEKRHDMEANVLGAISGAVIGHGVFVYATGGGPGVGVTKSFK